MSNRDQTSREEFRREAGVAFIANLKRLRKASGLSQENLSLRASLSRSHVGKIEKGDRLPELDTVHRLAGALGVEPQELFTDFYWPPDELDGDGHITDEPPQERYKA